MIRERLTIIKPFLGLGESLSHEVEENSWSYYNLDFDDNEAVYIKKKLGKTHYNSRENIPKIH